MAQTRVGLTSAMTRIQGYLELGLDSGVSLTSYFYLCNKLLHDRNDCFL